MVHHRCVALLLVFLFGLPSVATAVESEIVPTTHSGPPIAERPATSDEVVFSQRPAQVGDRVAQTVNAGLQVITTISQADQQAHESKNFLNRRQQRFIEVLEVAGGNVRRAHVTYPLSRLTSSEHEDPEQEVAQAVEKKSYLVTRAGERLLVTDTDGAMPSQAEFELVITSLQSLGLPNPLVKFLLGRTIRIGQRLLLPREVAEQMMGFGDQMGQVEQFELELKAVREVDGQPCAVFAATIAAMGEEANPIRIHAFGEVVIQIATCRTVRAELSGPLTLSKAEHTPEGGFQYKAQGTMRVAIQSQYGHARQ